jgi:plasmid stabilization system protein ParE
MTFRVEITSEAETDADHIVEWLLSQHAGDARIRWLQEMEQAISSLSEFPKRCSLAPESRVVPFEVRQLLYGRKPHVYRILFTIEHGTVYILHIRHGRREPVRP